MVVYSCLVACANLFRLSVCGFGLKGVVGWCVLALCCYLA